MQMLDRKDVETRAEKVQYRNRETRRNVESEGEKNEAESRGKSYEERKCGGGEERGTRWYTREKEIAAEETREGGWTKIAR